MSLMRLFSKRGSYALQKYGVSDDKDFRITQALPAPGACAPSGVTWGLSRLVLAHESRQAPSSVKRSR